MNGTVVGKGFKYYIVQWIDREWFGLLSAPYESDEYGTAMMFRHDADGRWQWTQAELVTKFAAEQWVVYPPSVRLEIVIRDPMANPS